MTQEVITLMHDLLLGMSQNCHSRYYRADIQATEMEACAKDEEALEDIEKICACKRRKSENNVVLPIRPWKNSTIFGPNRNM